MIDKAKILVVDDEPQIVSILKEFLSIKGFSVTGVLSAEEAIKILANESFDCVLLDIMMPGMKGNEAAKIINKKYPEVKIIILTGFLNFADSLIKENLLAGVFKKPFSLQELADKLSQIIELKQPAPAESKEAGKIQARVLIIKARILIIESSREIYHVIDKYLKQFTEQGKEYELDAASNDEEVADKIASFNPDIILANSNVLTKQIPSKEVIVYSASDSKPLQFAELEKLAMSIEVSCLKNGLIEIKWVEI
jgi:DNA-binding response OmpR family regulator